MRANLNVTKMFRDLPKIVKRLLIFGNNGGVENLLLNSLKFALKKSLKQFYVKIHVKMSTP